jgi:hypothetical protein
MVENEIVFEISKFQLTVQTVWGINSISFSRDL